MSRIVIRPLTWWFAAFMCLWLGATALAQNPRFAGTPAEEAALRTLNQYKLVKLREQAKEVLKQNPDSYAGHFMLGFSLHNSEGDLPRAKFHMQKSLDLFRKKHGKNFTRNSPWGWYERALIEMVQINAEMDQYESQVKTLDAYLGVSKRLFNTEAPTILVGYAWPLMKLDREEEARKKLRQVAAYRDESTRTTYLNTLGAIEMEFGHPAASYDAFKTLIDEVRTQGWRMTCTYLRNLGEAAAGIGHYDEAERLYSEATRYFDSFTYSNPWFDLTFLYLSQARFPEAVSALKKTHRWRFAIQPFLAQQTWAQDQHVTAELLLHLGETDKALEIAEMIVRRPDRQGGDSIRSDQKEAGTLMLYRALLMAEASRLQESLTWKSGWSWWQALAFRRKLLNDAKIAAIKVRSLASNNHRLSSSLRPYYAPGTFIMTDWHRPDLVTVYGAGVSSEALDEIYSNPPESFEQEKPALEVVRAEVAWARGDEEDAIDILKLVIPKIGESRAVLRARAEARLASILFDEGRFEEAMEYGTRVMDTAPAMFRHLKVAVPVRIEADQSEAAQIVAEALADSPRFYLDDRGYPIKIRVSGDKIIATLFTPQQSLLTEVSVSTKKRKRVKKVKKEGEEDDEAEEEEILDPPYELTALFHKKAFAPRLDLSQSEINSLDGSTLTDSRRNNDAREAIGLPTLRPSDRP